MSKKSIISNSDLLDKDVEQFIESFVKEAHKSLKSIFPPDKFKVSVSSQDNNCVIILDDIEPQEISDFTEHYNNIILLYESMHGLASKRDVISFDFFAMKRNFANLVIVPLIKGALLLKNIYKFKLITFHKYSSSQLESYHWINAVNAGSELIKNYPIWFNENPDTEIDALSLEKLQELNLLLKQSAHLDALYDLSKFDEQGKSIILSYNLKLSEAMGERAQDYFLYLSNFLEEFNEFDEFSGDLSIKDLIGNIYIYFDFSQYEISPGNFQLGLNDIKSWSSNMERAAELGLMLYLVVTAVKYFKAS